MVNRNPMCCGGTCLHSHGPVKVYPLGSGANLILCRACWHHENEYRRQRGDNRADWPIHNWNDAEEYPEP